MDRKAIQRILDYIEDNLKAEISVEELSDLAGFSLFHFYRLFQSAVGMRSCSTLLEEGYYMEFMRLAWGIKK